jgi:hypothetical protein
MLLKLRQTADAKQKSYEFSSLLFTVTNTALPSGFYFFKLTQPVTASSSTVHLLYNVKEKGGKQYLPPYGLRKPYRNLKSDNSQDYAQKLQQNCMFMNSAIGSLRPNSWSNWDKSLQSFPPCIPQLPPLTDFTPSPLEQK